MGLRNPTASSLDRTLHCPASLALPQANEQSDHADAGTAKHAFLVRAREIGKDKAIAEIPEDADHRQWCEQVPLDRLPQGGKLEMAVAWNSETDEARILGYDIGRDYEKAAREAGIDLDDPAWWTGTLDVAGRAGDHADNTDYKTGFRSAGDAKTAPQLLFGTLALTRLYGVDQGKQRFLYLNERGQVDVDEAEVDDYEHLVPFAQQLRALPARIEAEREKVRLGVIPDVSMGAWCTYCRAKRSCPAKAAQLVKALANARQLGANDGKKLTLNRAAVEALAPADAGRVFAEVADALPLLEELKSCIKEMAVTAPIPLPDGVHELREVSVKNKTKVDAEKAEKILYRDYGVEAAQEAVHLERRTTMKALSAMAIKRAARGKGAAAERELYDKLRAEGALVEGTHPEVKVCKVQ